eukprot:s702_g37.t1
MSTTPAPHTDTCVESCAKGSEDAEAFGGFRRRWRERSTGSAAGSQAEGSFSELFGGNGSEQQLDVQQAVFEDPHMDLPIKDVALDDVAEQAEYLADAKRQKTHAHARDALNNTDLKVFKYPWERGRLRKFFSDEPLVPVRVPSLKPGGRNFVDLELEVDATGHVSAKASIKPAVKDEAVFISVVKKLDDIPYPEDRKLQRQRAVEGWWNLLSVSLVSSTIGLKVTVEATMDTVLTCAHTILDAVFAVKSPGTLMRRLYAIQAFELWCLDHCGSHWMPVTELNAWRYVCFLKDSGAPPTKASSFLEALRFTWYLLGVDGAGEAEQSLRVKGVAAQLKAGKKPWRPADLLKLDEVLRLHSILSDETRALGDRLFCGHALHLLYGRCRWSDLASVSGLFLDSDACYLEVSTRCHKGGRSAEMKARLLPIASPAKGVDPSNWAAQYMSLRDRAGLIFLDEEPGPMMPAPMNEEASCWATRPLTSEEGSAFLRKILDCPKTAARRISTHSMKSTIMSWASKFGIGDNSRAVLARHVSSVSSATAVYSRDLLSPVLRELDAMLLAIRSGTFHPDRTRSGMITPVGVATNAPVTPFARGMPPLPQTPVVPVTKQKQVVHSLEDDSLGSWQNVQEPETVQSFSLDEIFSPASHGVAESETSEENSVQSSSSSEGEEEDEPQHRHFNFDPPTDLYINNNSLVIHCCRTPGVLKCGRRVSPNFSKSYELSGIRCSRCFDV